MSNSPRSPYGRRQIPLDQMVALRTVAARLKVTSKLLREQFELRNLKIYKIGEVFRVRLRDVETLLEDSEWTPAKEDAQIQAAFEQTLEARQRRREG